MIHRPQTEYTLELVRRGGIGCRRTGRRNHVAWTLAANRNADGRAPEHSDQYAGRADGITDIDD